VCINFLLRNNEIKRFDKFILFLAQFHSFQSFHRSNEVKKDIALITGRKLVSERAKEDQDDLREIDKCYNNDVTRQESGKTFFIFIIISFFYTLLHKQHTIIKCLSVLGDEIII
jgi:hypothetical protein